jgi:hypothetical protein
MFAWAHESNAAAVSAAMSREFERKSIQLDEWIVAIESTGARVIES